MPTELLSTTRVWTSMRLFIRVDAPDVSFQVLPPCETLATTTNVAQIYPTSEGVTIASGPTAAAGITHSRHATTPRLLREVRDRDRNREGPCVLSRLSYLR